MFRCTPDPFAQAQADSLATARQHLVALQVILAADSQARDSAARVNARNAVVAAQAKRQSSRADSLASELRAVLGGIRRADFDTILALKDSTINELTGQNTSLAAIVTLLDTRLAVADSGLAARDALLDAYKTQLTDALKRGTSKFACVGGLSVAGGFGGTATGIGATCGFKL